MLCVTRAHNHEKIIKDTKINITIYAFVKKNTRIEDDMNEDDGSRNKKTRKTTTTIPAAVTSAVIVVATGELTEIES